MFTRLTRNALILSAGRVGRTRTESRPPPLLHTAPPHVGAQLLKKGSPYSITERRVPELIPVLGSQPAGDESLCDVRLSVRLSVPSIDRCSSVRRVCCCKPRMQEILLRSS